jgi:LysR family transcriptional regulator, cys regulon transcriptional activator
MNIHQLRFIRATIRYRFNLSEAAKSLFTSQPGISKAILNFEEEIGAEIFIRQGKRLKGLTDIGVKVAENIDIILSKIDEIKRFSADYIKNEEGVLRIATTHTQARYTLPKVISKFSKKYPKVKLSILQGNPSQIINMLKDGIADIIVATEILGSVNDCDVIVAFNWQHVLVAPKHHEIFNIIHERDISLQELANYPIITYDKAFSGRKTIDDVFSANNITTEIILEAVDSDVIKTYVELNMGIGIMAEMAFDPSKDTNLRVANLGYLFGNQAVKIAYKHSTYQTEYTKEFVTLLSNLLGT